MGHALCCGLSADSGSQPGAALPLGRHLSTSGDVFACDNWERRGRWDAPRYLVSKARVQARVLLNILQCPGRALTGKNYSSPNVNNGQIKKPCYRLKKEPIMLFAFNVIYLTWS